MNEYNWRSVSVYRSTEFEPLVNKFAKPEVGEKKIFSNIKDFMVFAALVAFEEGKFEALKGVDKISITLDTYSTTNHDAYIYLLALHKTNNIDVMKNENLTETVRIFEGYCNAGLKVIKDWFEINSASEEALDVFFNQIHSKLVL